MTQRDRGGPARSNLEYATRDLHLSLHKDRLLSRLSSPQITSSQYLASLRVFLAVHEEVERARARVNRWPELSLRSSCEALELDLKTTSTGSVPHLSLDGAARVLGGLYVVHGAGFGRNMFRRGTRLALPSAPARYISQSMPPLIWRRLCAEVEDIGRTVSGFADLCSGARATFEFTAAAAAHAQHAADAPDRCAAAD